MVWLQGVWSLGTWALENVDKVEPSRLANYKQNLPDYTQEDIIGSPYAISEYTINPAIGGESALVDFRARLATQGIKLMLDFVPNHMAVDCTWCKDASKSSFFVHKPANTDTGSIEFDSQGRAYGRDLYSGAWVDTLQLNYWNPALRNAMVANLKKAAGLCDGLRNDMAMLLVNDVIERVWGPILRANGYTRPTQEFWSEAFPAIRSVNPTFFMMAEVYDWTDFTPRLDRRLQDLGFDATYDKKLYDDLGVQYTHLDNLRAYIKGLNQDGVLRKSVHFTENHDEESAVKHFYNAKRANTAAVLSLTLPGPRLMWYGQWEGKQNRLIVQLRRRAPEPLDTTTLSFYTRFNTILSHPVFQSGTWTYLDVVSQQSNTGWRLVAWKWVQGNVHRLVVVNYSEVGGDGRVKLEDLQGSGNVKVSELLGGNTYDRDANEVRSQGLWVSLEPFSAQIFEY
ncbi:hypothetical protein HK104_004613 [Borealophlyctis nickersoniae]|nr:hypothetical protein HK104_004613 [Borealophlyctis nickersoniae]